MARAPLASGRQRTIGCVRRGRQSGVSDTLEVVDKVGLGELDDVDLAAYPLSEQSINEHIPALQARGVTIDYQTSDTRVKTAT